MEGVVKDLKNKLAQFEGELAAKDREVLAKIEDIFKLEEEHSGLRSQLDVAKGTEASLAEQVTKLQKERDELKVDNE